MHPCYIKATNKTLPFLLTCMSFMFKIVEEENLKLNLSNIYCFRKQWFKDLCTNILQSLIQYVHSLVAFSKDMM